MTDHASNTDPSETPARITLIRAGAVAGLDAFGHDARPGAVAVAGGRVIDAGETAALERRYLTDAAAVIDRTEDLLVPGFVNAHAHFELNAIGPHPYTGTFTSWVKLLQRQRPRDAAAVGESVRKGVRMSLTAGVEAVGDIGGARFGEAAAWEALGRAPLAGVYFPELLAFGGDRADGELNRLRDLLAEPRVSGRMRRGISPHAPYSTGRCIYAAATHAAVEHGLVATTHLAEMPEEHQFVSDASGPFRVFLESLGVWEDDHAKDYRDGLLAVPWMEPYLRQAPWLLAHCNYVSDDDITLLAETGASVAYCPVASEYFGHQGHRYREMIEAGVNVCLGTDSIVCQPAVEIEPQPLGVLPQMRRLYQRDATDPALLLRMATTHGRRALRLDRDVTRLAAVPFDTGDATDALTQVLRNNATVRALELRGEERQAT